MNTTTPKPWLETPWDARVFGVPTHELTSPDPEGLSLLPGPGGHFTAKIPFRADAEPLRRAGFYYCDTLIEPWGSRNDLRPVSDAKAGFVRDMAWSDLFRIGHGAFHGRYHRDPAIAKARADARYDQWLRELYDQGRIYGLLYDGRPAGFIGEKDAVLVLHAMAAELRGQGLARALWSLVLTDLFDHGRTELHSSVSAGNLPIVNLYASLGFRFRNPLDVYHAWFPVPGGPARIE
ncbi:MAG: GNAT family N-acetyltransferase [Acidobacteriota bacterium]|nr:GNAT family N-acetyltransferase [Acidobacteriota bacterium]